ncbi:MAG TPA: adenylate/guanylate cyclase domain-containing protein [Acidimicrobiales bacterium]|nr:adenylate/guanylate cyclase domain-containing protein [Acidimicrobiales bacterium]
MTDTLTGTVTGTVAFTDIVGFTAYCAEVGDAAAVDLLGHQDRLVRAVLPDGARIVKELGDGLMLWFPSATDGVRACVELQARLAGSGDDFPLWLRVGLHTGEAVRRGDDLVGHHVNVASRIAGLAGPREILVSDATRAACGDAAGLGFHEVGPVRVKGVAEPIWIHRVESPTG